MSEQPKEVPIQVSGQQFLQRAFALSSVSAARDLYNEWATSYDTWLEAEKYMSPQLAVHAAMLHLPPSIERPAMFQVLDAGCGTGLVGVSLADAMNRAGQKFNLDGLDLAPGMLAAARAKDVYHTLNTGDLSKALNIQDETYDLVLCVGTLTKGHVGPAAMSEFTRVAKKTGLVVATVHNEVWIQGGFKEKVLDMERQQSVKILGTEEFGILKGDENGARMVVMQRT